jgi:hypothetical protein
MMLCLPTVGAAQDRLGEWVAQQLGYEPFYTQSIGWDMPAPTVRAADPFTAETGTSFVPTPETTAWVVGIMENEGDTQLTGMALVWSDGPLTRSVQLSPPQSRTGLVAFQTPTQSATSEEMKAALAAQLDGMAAGPILIESADGTLFAVGDSRLPDGCFSFSALYKSNDDLVALVVLFQSQSRVDADTPACIPLTS